MYLAEMMNFGIKVDKTDRSGAYKLTLVSESITPWENDLVNHDATTKVYCHQLYSGGLKKITAQIRTILRFEISRLQDRLMPKDFTSWKFYAPFVSIEFEEVRIKDGEKRRMKRIWMIKFQIVSFYFIQTVGGK